MYPAIFKGLRMNPNVLGAYKPEAMRMSALRSKSVKYASMLVSGALMFDLLIILKRRKLMLVMVSSDDFSFLESADLTLQEKVNKIR